MVKKYGARNKETVGERVVLRTIFGTKRIVKVDKFSKTKYVESDIRAEKFKIILWVVMFLLYLYFVILGKTI